MKYFIFGCEVVAMILWIIYGVKSIIWKCVGIIVIIAISQLAHIVFKAR
ncbi:hypothetical protein [Fructilactobacillus frigidiflavus]